MKTLRPSAAVLVGAIGVFVWLSVAVTGGGAVTRFDTRVAIWVAASMPGWASGSPGRSRGSGASTAFSRRRCSPPCGLRAAGGGSTYCSLPAFSWPRSCSSRRSRTASIAPGRTKAAPFRCPTRTRSRADTRRARSPLSERSRSCSLSDRGRRRALLVGGALVVAFCVGASRVVLNVHYVSDVGAGFCLGLAIVSASLLIREAILDCRGRRPRTPRRAVEGDRGPARLGP